MSVPLAEVSDEQAMVCARFALPPLGVASSEIVGVSHSVREGLMPLNGVRHRPKLDTSGWFLWVGEELSSSPDFFVPLHVSHLIDLRPEALPYLALPPGSRFLLAPGHEDVWTDDALLLE